MWGSGWDDPVSVAGSIVASHIMSPARLSVKRSAAVLDPIWGAEAAWNAIVEPSLCNLPVLDKKSRGRVDRFLEEGTIAPFLRQTHNDMQENGYAESTKVTYSSGDRYF